MLAIGTHTSFAYIYTFNGTKFVSNQTILNKQYKDMLKVDISGDGNWLLIMSGVYKDTIAYVYKR